MMRKLTIPFSENSSKNSFLCRKPYLFSVFRILTLFVLTFSINTSLFGQCPVSIASLDPVYCENTSVITIFSSGGSNTFSTFTSSLPVSAFTDMNNGTAEIDFSAASPGTYTILLEFDDGTNVCDVTETFEILANSTNAITYVGCAGDNHTETVGMTVYDENNPTGTQTLTNSVGCDSIVTINLVYNASTTGTVSYMGCMGDNYSVMVGGTIYNMSNPTGVETLMDANSVGCDSIVTIDLTFGASTTSNENYVGCAGDGYSITLNGNVYDENNTSGMETLMGANSVGCDSIVTINLDFSNLPTTSTETNIGCAGDGYSITVNGTVYDENNPTGTEILMGANSVGCDSTVTINLTFNATSTSTVSYMGCMGDGYSVMVGANTYDMSNPTGTETLVNSVNCDSIVTINLIYNAPTTGTENYMGCTGDGYFVIVNGTVYNESNPTGTETLTGASAVNCDSTVIISLAYNTSTASTQNYTGCMGDGYSITINGTVYDENNPTGMETLTGAGVGGCDSIVTINFDFSNLPTTSTQTNVGCTGDGYSITVNGTIYNESNPTGTEILTGANSVGCDSTVTINLTFNATSTSGVSYMGCMGDGHIETVNGTVYDQSNPTGTETLVNSVGCDSIITINLIYNAPTTGTESYMGCTGDGYFVLVNGTVYNESSPTGTETLIGANSVGCDSIVTVNLSFGVATTSTQNYTGCTGDGYSITVNGTVYNETNLTGTEVITGGNSVGCDSTVTINLTYLQSTTSTESYAGCSGDGYSITVNGNVYNETNPTGTEVLTGANSVGCDSTVSINLNFIAATTSIESYAGCSGDAYSVTVNGTVYNENNPTGTETLAGANSIGCDSIITINLSFNSGSATVPTITGPNIACSGSTVTIDAGAGYSSYLWSQGGTTQAITITPGLYSVTVSEPSGCTATASYTVGSSSNASLAITNSVICPSASNGTLTVTGGLTGSTYAWSGPNSFSATTATISGLTAGTYIVTVTDSNCSQTATGMVVQTPNISATLASVQICTGAMTTLDAGPGMAWNWNTGATTQTITVGQGTYTVTVTEAVGNGMCTDFGSATVTETTNPNIAISASSNVICSNPGSTITLSVAGGGAYTWSGPSIVGSNTGTSITINAAGTYTVTDINGCGGLGTINIADGQPNTILAVNASPICSGNTAIFTLGGGGSGSSYQLYINGIAVGAATPIPTWSSATLSNNDLVYVETTNAFGCIGNSNTITMQVDQFNPILVASPSTTICAGTTVTYLANGGGTGGTYEFFINGISQGVQSTNFFNPATVNNGDVITVNVSNTNGCSGLATPNPLTMTVNPALVVSLTASGNSNCAGAAATFTASDNSGQTGVTYQFFVNNVLQSSSGNTFTSSTLVNGDIIHATATTSGNASCTAQSNSITINSSAVTASIATNTGGSTFCSGEIVTFFANGGSSYEYFINGVSQGVSGINSLTTNSLVTGTNTVSVTVSNSVGCSNTAALTINVTAAPTITISQSATNICAGSPVTFTASGASQFEFFINGLVAQATSTSGSFTTTALANGDVVSVTGYTSGMCSPNVVYNQVTVSNNTSAGTISGGNSICQGSTVQLASSSTITSGTWLSSNNSIASVSGSGLVTGNSPGTVNVTYTVVSGGCTSTSQPYAVFVSQTGSISVTSSDSDNIICAGDPLTLTASGGTGSSYTWTDNLGTILPSTATITVNPAVGVTSYTVTASGGTCAGTQTLPITVNAAPVAGIITGNTSGGANVCEGISMALNASASGGVVIWSSSNPSVVSINASTGMITTTTNASLLPASAVITYTVSNNGCTVTSPAFAVNVSDCSTATVGGVKVSPKVLLEGPYNTATQLMNDDLRQLPTSLASPFPLTEPYSTIVDPNNANLFVHSGNGGGETTTAAVLAATGNNAIVDWVFLELRSGTNSSTVMSTVSALIQRDGDIVDVDGVSPVCLAGANGMYHLAVRHRNHVGIMTANPIALSSSSTTVIDLSTPVTTTPGYMAINGTHPVDTINNRLVMYGGDANSDGQTIFSGPNNDRDYVFFEILGDVNNTNSSFNHIRTGYYQGDTNLDGEVKYQGPTNDLDRLMFFNVIFYPGSAGIINGIIVQQIP